MSPLIIERPDLRNWRQELITRVLSFVFWAVWLGLLTPAAAYVGHEMQWIDFAWIPLQADIVYAMQQHFPNYLISACSFAGVFLMWAKVNELRFRDRSRRRGRPAVQESEMAQQFVISDDVLAKAKGANRVVVDFSIGGTFSILETDQPQSRPSIGTVTPLHSTGQVVDTSSCGSTEPTVAECRRSA